MRGPSPSAEGFAARLGPRTLRVVNAPSTGPDARARLLFHVGIGAILLSCLAPLVTGALAIVALNDARRDPGAPGGAAAAPDARRSPWTRRLVALALLDVFVAAAFGVMLSHGLPNKALGPPPGPRIGVVLRDDRPGVVQIAEVIPGGPAARAGIAPGDRVESVDGEAVKDRDGLLAIVGRTPKGGARTLAIVRDDTRREVSVVPESSAHIARSAPLFTSGGSRSLRAALEAFATPLLELTALLVLAVVAAIRRAPRAWLTPLGLGAVFVVSAGLSVGLLSMVGAGGDLTRLAELSSLATGAALLLAGGAIGAWRWRLARRQDERPAASAPRTVLLGLLYAYGLGGRLGILFAAAAPLLGAPQHSAAEVFGLDTSWGAGGIGLFVLIAVVLAPVGEELVFRGTLLPWLRTWMSDRAAIVVSAAAFGAGHLYYGVGAVQTFVYGIVLGWARVHTGRLRAPIGIHMSINALAAGALVALAVLRSLGLMKG